MVKVRPTFAADLGRQKGASELDAGDLASLVGGIFGLSKFGRDDDGRGGGGKDDDTGKGNPTPSSFHGTASGVPNLTGKTCAEGKLLKLRLLTNAGQISLTA